MEVCYRHNDRETGVSCSNCGRPICPDCMTTTPVGMRCPECSRERTKVHTAQTLRAGPRLTPVLIGICVLVYLGGMLGGPQLQIAGVLYGPAVAEGEYWRLITAGFLHGGIGHLFLNMFSLWILGSLIEPAIGTARFAIIYFASLLTGSLGALLLQPDAFTVGASGAIFGLMGAAFIILRERGMNIMESGLGIWIGLNLVLTFVIPGISIGGHLGGLAGGVLCAAAMFGTGRSERPPVAVGNGMAISVGVLAVIAAVMIA